MNILVIGGTGFLGRYIVEQLTNEDLLVTVLTRNPEKITLFSQNVAYVVGDLLNYQKIDFSPYTHIINCSGELKDDALMYRLHVECVAGILKQLKNTNPYVHWLHVSSVGVYGAIRQGIIVEDSPFAPVGRYEVTKAQGDLLVKQFCTDNKIKYTIIRPSNVFGVGMPNQSLAQLISMIRKKLFFYIGTNTNDVIMNYVPVEDVANLITLCINDAQAINQEFIISDHILLSDFVHIICKELSIKNSFRKIPESLVRLFAVIAMVIPKIPLTQARIDALTMRVRYSTERANKKLKYKPVRGLSSGLKKYVSNFKF